jgi:hypothetical protein
VLIHAHDHVQVTAFNAMYELYDPCTVMFFFRNKHIMIDLGTGNNNKINWAMNDKQEFIDIVEVVYRGARKGRGLVVSPKGVFFLFLFHLTLTRHVATYQNRSSSSFSISICDMSCLYKIHSHCILQRCEPPVHTAVLFARSLSSQPLNTSSFQCCALGHRTSHHEYM